MEIIREPLSDELRRQLIDYVYPIIGKMHYVHNELGPGLREYIYQEALALVLRRDICESTIKEYVHYPMFEGVQLESYIKTDLMVPLDNGNVIVECKSISEITDKERYQTFGYLRATMFPIALIVNFGTWPKAQIERYYFDRRKMTIRAF